MEKQQSLLKSNIQVFDCGSNLGLSLEICKYLGLEPGKLTLSHFADGELCMRIDQSVRGADVFVVQSTCAPVAENIMKLLVVMDAMKRASAARITAVIPYYGYARQDKKFHGREPITAKLVANILTSAGADRIIVIDLHTPSIQGFFDIPVDHLSAQKLLAEHLRKRAPENLVVVSPDAGGVMRARAFAKVMGAPLAIIDKRRPKPNEVEMMNIIGDISGCSAVLVDDMIDTAGTICQAADALKKQGANHIYAMSTHAVLSGPAVQRIEKSALSKVVVTNTIPHPAGLSEKLEPLSVAPLVAEAMKRIHTGESVSDLF